ncbi:MAG: VIT1/CCC1 transporter family protein [bacterium]
MLPFLLKNLIGDITFVVSATITGLTFLSIGVLKEKILNRSMIWARFDTLMSGGGAGLIAYGIGAFLCGFVHI